MGPFANGGATPKTTPRVPPTLIFPPRRHGGPPRPRPPALPERLFVLAPRAEIAPDAVHPVHGAPVRQLLDRLSVAPLVRRFEPSSLYGLRAVVTGSTRGIGQAIAHELAAAGARVATHGRGAPSEATATALRADLSDAGECRHLVEEAWAVLGGIDVWVNNPG